MALEGEFDRFRDVDSSSAFVLSLEEFNDASTSLSFLMTDASFWPLLSCKGKAERWICRDFSRNFSADSSELLSFGDDIGSS